MIYVIATFTIHPGQRDAVLAAVGPCIEGTRQEPGCLFYDLHESVTQPHTFVFVERWMSKDHLKAHTQTPHFKAWREAGGPMIASRQIEVITPESVGGL